VALYNSHYQQCSNGHLRETSNIGRLAPVLLIGPGGEMPIGRHLPVVFAMSPQIHGRYEWSDADPDGKHLAERISQPNHLNLAGPTRLPALFHRIAILFCRHLSSSNGPFRHSTPSVDRTFQTCCRHQSQICRSFHSLRFRFASG
jgi:hypothetical protein